MTDAATRAHAAAAALRNEISQERQRLQGARAAATAAEQRLACEISTTRRRLAQLKQEAEQAGSPVGSAWQALDDARHAQWRPTTA